MANTSQDHASGGDAVTRLPATRRFEITDANAWLVVTPPEGACIAAIEMKTNAGYLTTEDVSTDDAVNTALPSAGGDHYKDLTANALYKLRIQAGRGASGNRTFAVAASVAGTEVQVVYSALEER